MATKVTIDLRHVARGTSIPVRQIQTVVELLDEGNTVPFITRYRKDQTGGLDEEQIREIQSRLVKIRLLAERKETILRSIEGQGKLTEELSKQIFAAGSTKRLEDLYLPFRPKKQTRATVARSRGLDVLAQEIVDADPGCADLDARAADFVNPDREVGSAADALLGAGHILAEQFSERADLRQKLREILERSGKLVSSRIDGKKDDTSTEVVAKSVPSEAAADTSTESSQPSADKTTPAGEDAVSEEATSKPTAEDANAELDASSESQAEPEDSAPKETESQGAAGEESPDAKADAATAADPTTEEPTAGEPSGTDGQQGISEQKKVESTAPPQEDAGAANQKPVAKTDDSPQKTRPKKAEKQAKLSKRELRKKKAEEKKIKAFGDYFEYAEELKKIPPHRVLAINRGERAKVLRVKMEYDLDQVIAAAEPLLVPAEHPHSDYLRGCAKDALTRLVLPGLERELRRDMTDRAENHAVTVFAKNLRNLLLQQPVHDRRVLAVDPGFKSGCKLAALDQFGNVLDHAVIYLVGKAQRRKEARKTVIDLIQRFQLSVVAIGNGTACRQCEDFFADLITADELKEQTPAYVIVSEAGASVYSASRLGREEFPNYDATLRGAISIGRRLQDPLSELVKIDAGSIGVGMYQHDIKAKHLRNSLDEVVESCVNYVGVDVNMASPALLRYVSGLNQLTARRLFEHRRQNGPFRNRAQLMEVPGIGETTFVQAAGFLKIGRGDNPLDTTWIHPESYEAATRVLEGLQCTIDDLRKRESVELLAKRIGEVDRSKMAEELGIGTHSLADILTQLTRPGRDPREDLPAPVFKRGVMKLEDLTPGMELTGTVLNVVDFGAFIDIGIHDSGLVHVSHLADQYVRDPHEVVAVGGVVKVWVIDVDKERRRVSLTMVQPGTERPRRPRRGEKPSGGGTTKGEGSENAGGGRRRRSGGEATSRGSQSGQRRGGRGGESGGAGRSGGGRRSQRGKPGGRGRGKPSSRPKYEPKSRPKPFVPITEGMKEGKEAMRTFGDLAQFFEVKQKEKGKPETKGKRARPKKSKKPQTPPTSEMKPPSTDENVQPPDDETKLPLGSEKLPTEPTMTQETPSVETTPSEGTIETSPSPTDEGGSETKSDVAEASTDQSSPRPEDSEKEE